MSTSDELRAMAERLGKLSCSEAEEIEDAMVEAAALMDKAAEEMEWRPIETFVDDGEKHLFWIDWADDCKDLNPPIPNAADHRMVWCRYRCWSSVHKATHWRPLPSPPASLAVEERE